MAVDVFSDEINAAARIIGDISTGIYRSPANALKELVSNSFDAGATEVFISTDHPAFTSASCYDNGKGISLEELRTVFRYIGASDKRLQGDKGPYGRPVIGKIGIGILAMSQISKRFVIISSRQGENFRIEAEVNIEEFETSQAARTNLGTGKIGRYRIYTIPDSPESHYTIIATPASSMMLRQNLGPGKSPRDYFVRRGSEAATFREFVEDVSNVARPATLSAYQAFLWELASLCPVAYFEDGPVRGWEGWKHIKERLEAFRFSVTVDGYELRKPILLPTTDDLRVVGDDYQIYPFSYEDDDGIGLQFEGYILHQRKQIAPAELQGLLVRIRNVGIGGYDATLLKYPRNIGPMVRGMTGEVYVHVGLEDALNIDRNSFNETHFHILKLREVVFRHLGIPGQGGITKDIRDRSQQHQEALRSDKTSDMLERLARRLQRATRKAWAVKMDPNLDGPLHLIEADAIIRVNLEHDTVPSGTAARSEFFRVCLAARLLESLGPPSDEKDALVGWLRKL